MGNWLLKTKVGLLLKNAAGTLVRTCQRNWNTGGNPCCKCSNYPPLQISIKFWGITACPGKSGDIFNGNVYTLDLDPATCDYDLDYCCAYVYTSDSIQIVVGHECTSTQPRVDIYARVYDGGFYIGAFAASVYGCPGLTCYMGNLPNALSSLYCAQPYQLQGYGGFCSYWPYAHGAWQIYTFYGVGDRVLHGDNIPYTCIVAHESSADREPGVGASWAEFWQVTDCPIPDSWVTAHTYYTYTWVINNGTRYWCTLLHVSSASTEPGVGASWTTAWEELW